MLRSDLCDYSDAYIVVKGTITVTRKTFTSDDIDAPNNTEDNVTATIMQIIMLLVIKNWFLKTMHRLSIVFQKLMV